MKKVFSKHLVYFFFISLSFFFFKKNVSAYYTNMPASVVIGQQDFTSRSINQGGTVGANTLSTAIHGFWSDGKKLIVVDQSNHRVLIYNNIPTTNNTSADIVIGQTNLTTNSADQGGTAGANTLRSPRGVCSDGTRLVIVESGNNRALIFDTIPTQDNASADWVVGQANFSATSANAGGRSEKTISGPRGCFIDQNGKLYISDTDNHRVLIFNSIPRQHNASADVVIGQSSFATGSVNSGGLSPRSLSAPGGIWSDGNKLLIADQNNHRILVFHSVPTTNAASADVIIGQPDSVSNSMNQGGSANANTLRLPRAVFSDGQRLFIGDTDNSRVLIYNSIPTVNNASADMVIGQPDFTSSSGNQGGQAAANTLVGPSSNGILVANNKLFIGDGGNTNGTNARVLIFDNSLPHLSLQRTITGQPDGKLRFSGIANTNLANQTIIQIEYSVNGSTWIGGFASDGIFDSSLEKYYFDFDPSVNMMAGDQGYTVKMRATHNNDKDAGTSTLFFEPFQSLSPVDNAFTLNRLPTFSFNIQKVRFQDLKENLDRFTISLSTDGVDFRPYIDNIPVDYNSVRLHPDNLKPNKIDEMNGLYEDKFKIVSYTEENSHITVTPKGTDKEGNSSDKLLKDGGTLLQNGVYYWRIEALDKAGQIQFTDTKTLRIGTYQTVTSRAWFPLALQVIGGNQTKQQINVSTTQPHLSPEIIRIDSRWPWFRGIATAGSTVRLILKKEECKKDLKSSYYTEPILDSKNYCTRLYETTTLPNSTFFIAVPWELIPDRYEVSLSVKDTGDNYNELPPFLLTISDTSQTE